MCDGLGAHDEGGHIRAHCCEGCSKGLLPPSTGQPSALASHTPVTITSHQHNHVTMLPCQNISSQTVSQVVSQGHAPTPVRVSCYTLGTVTAPPLRPTAAVPAVTGALGAGRRRVLPHLARVPSRPPT